MRTDPHPVPEDPEEHLGPVIPDPWDDPEQTDWPKGVDDGLDTGPVPAGAA